MTTRSPGCDPALLYSLRPACLLLLRVGRRAPLKSWCKCHMLGITPPHPPRLQRCGHAAMWSESDLGSRVFRYVSDFELRDCPKLWGLKSLIAALRNASFLLSFLHYRPGCGPVCPFAALLLLERSWEASFKAAFQNLTSLSGIW